MKWVVCFDIKDDKKRKIIGDMLGEYGVRVQRSVFEIEITDTKLEKILEKIERMIDNKEDSLRFYPFHKDTVKKTICLGFGLDAFEGKEVYFF
jgi:CRISPR-associated protein Cas2